MKPLKTNHPDILLLEPEIYSDARGFFMESFNQREFERVLVRSISFVQDNHSRSSRYALRGLHYQDPNPQEKLVRVAAGTVFSVAVDIRKDSPHFGTWVGAELSGEGQS
jgi:dTDP-4-dehydrorhamnose 3,5-epimerase